jgi:DNA-binding MarR family transcriptional regulator
MNDNYLNKLNLIDLISEQHLQLRDKVSQLSVDDVNKTEGHILAVLERETRLTISEMSKIIHISRQGTHKCVQGLLAKQYVTILPIEGNLRDKHVMLTEKGKRCCHNLLQIKQEMENQIVEKLGKEQVEALKILLQRNWLI